MKLQGIGACVVLTLALMVGVMAQGGAQNDKQFQAALHKEMVEGDLKGAIEEYRKVAGRPGVARELAATSLLHVADCYQKLGDAQARAVYEQLLREYADQGPIVVEARARLGGAPSAEPRRGVTLRKVWTSDAPSIAGARGDTEYAISADGRFMTYIGNFNTTLFLRDLTTGRDRPLTGEPCCGIYVSTISKDGTAVAFNMCSSDQATCQIRSAKLSGTSVPVSQLVYASEDLSAIAPKDWSPDGKLIAVSLRRKDRTAQIGLIEVASNKLRVLKSVDWRGPTEMFFSPDGRDIAYDLPVSENGSERDVFVIATDGSRELNIASHPGNDTVVGWDPDGSRLLFSSDRSGAVGLWAQPLADRNPHGAPSLVKADIGPMSALGMTREGALFLEARSNDSDIEVAAVDLADTGREASSTRPIQRFTGTNLDPAWSPDGTALAYRSVRGEEVLVAIRSTQTAETRELHLQPRLNYFTGLSWARDGRSFAVYGTDLKGRSGVFRIDADNGRVVPILYQSHVENLSYEGFFWSPDGRRLYFHGQRGSIYEVDVDSHTERVLVAAPPMVNPGVIPDGRLGPISLSPDGHWIATSRRDAPGKSSVATLVPVDGGAPRDLFRVDDPDWVNNTAMPWLPDGRAILVRKMKDPDGRASELWRVPIDGTPAKKLEFNVSRVASYAQGRISVHPTGDRVAFVVSENKSRTEVWSLENFLPVVTTRK